MLLTRRFAARTAGLAALGLVATLSTALPASAANDWGTLDDLDDAKLQACKVSADGGDAWKIKLRVKNGNGYRVKSTARVYEGGDATDSRWASGWVRRGDTSPVGSVKMGRGSAFEVEYSLNADQLGGGGLKGSADIGRC